MTLNIPLTRRASLALLISAAGSAAFAQATSTDTPVIQEFSLGDENAPIEIIEYSSFTCPHCANFHRDVFPDLKANFIDTGKVRLIYRPVYFDGPGLWADMMARCPADNEKFFEIVELLFQQQREWSRAGSQAAVARGIVSVAREVGLSEEDVLACLQDNHMAQALVADFQANAEHHGINATPSFVIDGVLTQNMPYDDFAQLLNDKLDG